MIKKWIFRCLTCAFVLSLATLSSKELRAPVSANGLTPRLFFPIFYKAEPTRLDDFEDEDPVWYTKFAEPNDGLFFHRDGRLVGEVRDNSGNSIAYPGWRPLGDFKLEADARFSDGRWMNALGLVFGGSDDWQEYYGFLIAFNFKQHYWAVVRAKPPEQSHSYLSDGAWGGVPGGVVHSESRWNHLMIVREGSSIRVYSNGIHMPNGTYSDSHYGSKRLVGLLMTSYEWDRGEVEFDNFELTPLSMPIP